MHSYKALIALLGVFGVPGTTIAASLGNINNLVMFNLDGSSSMRAIMEFLIRKIETDGEVVMANITNIGSNTALRRVLQGLGDFALVSHDVSEDAQKNAETWKKMKLKTITLAKDPIVVVYKSPEDCDKDLVLSKDNVSLFYSVFSGHKYQSLTDDSVNFKSLVGFSANEACNVKILPWVKNGGPLRSGTAQAFVKNGLLDELCDENGSKEQCKSWVNKNIKKDTYGVDFEQRYVQESNSLHWESFINNAQPGSITYFPGHFVFLNWHLLGAHGLKIAGIKYKDGGEIRLSKSDYLEKIDKYKWGRTFNIVYPVDKVQSKVEQYLPKIVENASKLGELSLVPVHYEISSDNVTSNGTNKGKTKDDKIKVKLTQEDEVDSNTRKQLGIPFSVT